VAFLGAQKTKQNTRKMDSLSPSTWGKGLLNAISISSRGQTPSPQTPSPQKAPQNSSTSKNEAAARNALIAGAIGAGMSVLGTQDDFLLEQGLRPLSTAERAANAAATAAMFAGAAGTFTASEGSVLTRALKAGAGSMIATYVVGGPAYSAASKMKFGRPYV
jgi:hypothetical protein